METCKSSNYDNAFIYDDKNRIYILLGNTDSFIDKCVNSVIDKMEFYYIYEISVNGNDIFCSFATSNLLCPIKRKINIMIYEEYRNIIGSCLLNTCSKGMVRSTDPDKIYVYVLCYRNNKKIKTITLIKLHKLLSLKDDIVIDGYTINDLSFFYTCPDIIKQTNIKDRDTLYKNIILRKELNKLITCPSSSPLWQILYTFVVTINDDDIYKIIIEDDLYDTNDINKLIKFNYDRRNFNAFVRAWYSGQLSNCSEDNEKIVDMYMSLKSVL